MTRIVSSPKGKVVSKSDYHDESEGNIYTPTNRIQSFVPLFKFKKHTPMGG